MEVVYFRCIKTQWCLLVTFIFYIGLKNNHSCICHKLFLVISIKCQILLIFAHCATYFILFYFICFRYIRSAAAAGPDMFLPWNTTINRSSKRGNPSKSCVLKYQQSQIEVYARFIISSPGQGIEYFRSRKTLVLVTDLVMKHIRTANSNIARIHHSTVQGVSPGMTSVQVLVLFPLRSFSFILFTFKLGAGA